MRATSPRIERWLACARKDCCSYTFVCLTGDDLVRIARALSLEPAAFATLIAAPDDAEDGFIFDGSNARRRLALHRRASPLDGRGTCAFLMELTGGVARCGLGELRPTVCLAFPAVRAGDGIAVDATGCTCAWSDYEPDAATQAIVERGESERRRHAEIVARWNAYVRASDTTTPFTLHDLGRYLLDAYAA